MEGGKGLSVSLPKWRNVQKRVRERERERVGASLSHLAREEEK